MTEDEKDMCAMCEEQHNEKLKQLRTRVAELEAELEQAKRSEKVYRTIAAASMLILNDWSDLRRRSDEKENC